ncbi:unnamed protein product [Closterium sp. NIES-64]|nr:unnamed protein product [Closterium sp. NIES-64]
MPPAGAAAAAAAAAKGAPTSVQPLPVAAINGGAGSGAGGASGTGSGAAGGTALGVAGAGNAVKAPMMVFTPREDVALEDLERILPPLGFGSGGRVYRVRHKKTGKEYALKVIQEKYDEEVRKQIIQEMQILRRARSDHVVECYGIFDHLGEISFVLELMDGGTLADVTKKRGKIPESFMPEVTRQCLQGLLYLHRQHVVHRDIKPSNLLFNRQGQGLLYLHRQHVVHRDIKPSNLLFNRQGQVKIADFGVSKELASTLAQCNSYVGTSAYLSPERTNPPPGEGYDGYLSDVKIADFGVSKELASTLAQCNSYVDTSAYLSPERINPPPGEGYNGYLSDVWSMGLSLLELSSLLSLLLFVIDPFSSASVIPPPLSQVKIADFGVSKELASTLAQCNSYVGTSAYLSPERINPPPGEGYDGYLSDVWSMGLSLLELVIGRFPYVQAGQSADWMTLFGAIVFNEPPEAPGSCSPEFQDFIRCCLQKEPKKRKSAAELLEHPFCQLLVGDPKWTDLKQLLPPQPAQPPQQPRLPPQLHPNQGGAQGGQGVRPGPGAGQGTGQGGQKQQQQQQQQQQGRVAGSQNAQVQQRQQSQQVQGQGQGQGQQGQAAVAGAAGQGEPQRAAPQVPVAGMVLQMPTAGLSRGRNVPVQMQGAVGPMGQLGGQQMSQQTSQQMSFQMGQQQGMGVMQGFAQGQMQASIQSQPQPQVQMQGMGQYQQQQQPTVGGQVAGQQQQYSVQPGVKHYQPNPQMLQQLTAAQQALPTQKQEKVKRKYDEVVIDARKAAVGPGEEDLSVVAAQSTRQSRGRQAQRRDSPDRTAENDGQADVVDVPSYEGMDARQKKLFEIRLKLNQARKANQTAVVAEKRREEKPEEEESRGVSKAAWFEEKKRKMSKQLDAAGLDITKAYMLETQEAAESKYKKWEKKEAPFGWDAFNQQALYNAYKKRTGNIPYTEEDYLKAKEKDPDFYRDDASLQYGQAPEIPEENVDRMVAELTDRAKSRKEFSRRRRHHDEKDIDSINDRNEHFNRKIERAFGKYTVEIKNNLERGTALPD